MSEGNVTVSVADFGIYSFAANQQTVAVYKDTRVYSTPSTSNNVTVTESANGKVTITPSNIVNGGNVIVTSIPDIGYELDGLAITDKHGNNISYSKNSDGTYLFTMPDSDVTISATFIEITWSNPFADVSESAWYYDAVKYAHKNNIMQGTGNGLFEPNINLNRAMLVQMLYSLEGRPSAGESSFNDVADGSWYADAIAWASTNGVVNGIGNNLFAPTSDIAREQMAVMLYNYCIYKGIELPIVRETGSFADGSVVSSWAKEAVEAMYQAGILNGKGNGVFDPRGTATRAEVAQMMMNFLEAIK